MQFYIEFKYFLALLLTNTYVLTLKSYYKIDVFLLLALN